MDGVTGDTLLSEVGSLSLSALKPHASSKMCFAMSAASFAAAERSCTQQDQQLQVVPEDASQQSKPANPAVTGTYIDSVMTREEEKPVFKLFDETKGESLKWFYFADEQNIMVRDVP